MNKPALRLTEVDISLYLAGALPLGKRLLFRWALAVDPDLRARLAETRAADAEFRRTEMPGLRKSLFPASSAHAGAAASPPRLAAPGFPPRAAAPGSHARAASEPPPFLARFRSAFGAGPALAGAFCALLLAPLLLAPGLRFGPGSLRFTDGSYAATDDDPDAIAKGSGLGVALLVKGDTAYRVERQAVLVRGNDTLQVIPLGTEPQHLALLGWDPRQGLVRLFPRVDGPAPRVSRSNPPPALLPQAGAGNRLICVTANGPFTVAQAEAALRAEPFRNMENAPASHLGRGLYLQVFSIDLKSEGI
jgi:hypothetical protein